MDKGHIINGANPMTEFIQLFVSGLATGSIYALAAIGFTLLWQASQTINFAQGEFVMLPAFFVLAGTQFFGLSFGVAILVALGLDAGRRFANKSAAKHRLATKSLGEREDRLAIAVEVVVEVELLGGPAVDAPLGQHPQHRIGHRAAVVQEGGVDLGAFLVVLRGPNTGARFLLDDDEVMSGRHPDSDIFLDDVTVSRKHAIFRRTSEGFVVRDVGSLNGTYVNRELVDEATLKTGDEVQIGKFRLVFYASQA